MSNAPIIEQYGADDFVARVNGALRQAGFGDGAVPWASLAPLDQFHVGGADATTALAEKLVIPQGAALLDLGCGLGGPSRHLASAYGCSVAGFDLNPALIDLATMLTHRAGLSDRVAHSVGDVTDLPVAAGSFDLAWTQHVAMNIADRRGFYAGVHRALRPGGRFAIYDVVAGEGPLHFPVPWARDPAASFLLTQEETRAALEACGFEVVAWADSTDAGRGWQAAQGAAAQARPEGLRALALPLVMGPDFPARVANLGRNFQEGRARLLQAVVRATPGPR